MSETDGPYIYGLPDGRRLEPDGGYPEGVLGNIWGLTPADEWRLRQARQNFIEVNPDDFDVQGKDWIDRATGKSYRMERSDPTVGDDPKDSGIEVFFVTEDQRLVYLKPLGSEGRTKSVYVGTLRGQS